MGLFGGDSSASSTTTTQTTTSDNGSSSTALSGKKNTFISPGSYSNTGNGSISLTTDLGAVQDAFGFAQGALSAFASNANSSTGAVSDLLEKSLAANANAQSGGFTDLTKKLLIGGALLLVAGVLGLWIWRKK
jgi:hypothetical protein